MTCDVLGWVLWDSEIAEIFRSPFVVPVAGCLVGAATVVGGFWAKVRTREIASQERLARMAQGLPVESEWEAERQLRATEAAAEGRGQSTRAPGVPSDGAGAHRAGLILCSIGFGLIVFFAFLSLVLRERDVFSGACSGIIPLAIGIGFLIDARKRREMYHHWLEAVRTGAPGFMAPSYPGMPAPPPPPAGVIPPPGLTPAQASDWRPSSSTLK